MTGPFLYLPSGHLVMCGWSQASPPRTSPIWSIFCQQPHLPYNILFMSSISLYLRLFTKPIDRPRDDSDCWFFRGLHSYSLPLQHVGRMGHRAVDGQSHVTVWGPQTLGGGCLWRKQALTATLTNNTHSCRKTELFISAKPPPTTRWQCRDEARRKPKALT